MVAKILIGDKDKMIAMSDDEHNKLKSAWKSYLAGHEVIGYTVTNYQEHEVGINFPSLLVIEFDVPDSAISAQATATLAQAISRK